MLKEVKKSDSFSRGVFLCLNLLLPAFIFISCSSGSTPTKPQAKGQPGKVKIEVSHSDSGNDFHSVYKGRVIKKRRAHEK